MRDWTIIQTIREFTGGDGQYAVVQYTNGTYGITHDGEPLRPFFWHAGQLEDCISMTGRLARLSAAPKSTPSTVHVA